MQKGSDLQQHVNVFNNIITYLVMLWVNIDDKDTPILFMCLLLPSYDHLVTTLTYEKVIISLDLITATTLSHSRWRESVEEITQGDDMYVKGSRSWVDQR